MKLRKILALALTFIISIQSIGINSFADSYFETNENVVEEDIHNDVIDYSENEITLENNVRYVKIDDNNYMMFSEEYPDGKIIPTGIISATVVLIVSGVSVWVVCSVIDGVIIGVTDQSLSQLTASQVKRVKKYLIGKYVNDVNETEVPNYNCHPAWGSSCHD